MGLEVHEASIEVTLAEAGASGEVRHFGSIGGDLEAIAKLLRRLRRENRELRFVYEAGPCSFEIDRFPREQGLSCIIVSPSQIPRRSRSTARVSTAAQWPPATTARAPAPW